jgi:hypothetical protein
VKKAAQRRIGTPKSKNSVREFQIDASLVALLRRVRDTALRIVAGVPADIDVDLSLVKLPKDTLAFPVAGTLTKIRNPAAVTNGFKRHAAKLGFPVHLHDLLASHSTAMLDRGGTCRCMLWRSASAKTRRRCCAVTPSGPRRPTSMPTDAIAAMSKGVL